MSLTMSMMALMMIFVYDDTGPVSSALPAAMNMIKSGMWNIPRLPGAYMESLQKNGLSPKCG